MTPPITFALSLPTDVVERLQALANQKQISLSAVLQDALDSYLENEEEWEDTPDEEILADCANLSKKQSEGNGLMPVRR